MLSSNVKYIGLDVHQEAITVAVRNGAGKLVMESIVETKASTLLDFLHGLQGELHVTLEELDRSALRLRPTATSLCGLPTRLSRWELWSGRPRALAPAPRRIRLRRLSLPLPRFLGTAPPGISAIRI